MQQERLTEEDIQGLYAWIDEIPLSRPKRNIARDFADGVLCAEVVKHFLPKLVDIHNYSAASSVSQKLYNWNTLNQKVFKRLNYSVSAEIMDSIVNNKPGYVEYLLFELRAKIEKYMQTRKDTVTPTITEKKRHINHPIQPTPKPQKPHQSPAHSQSQNHTERIKSQNGPISNPSIHSAARTSEYSSHRDSVTHYQDQNGSYAPHHSIIYSPASQWATNGLNSSQQYDPRNSRSTLPHPSQQQSQHPSQLHAPPPMMNGMSPYSAPTAYSGPPTGMVMAQASPPPSHSDAIYGSRSQPPGPMYGHASPMTGNVPAPPAHQPIGGYAMHPHPPPLPKKAPPPTYQQLSPDKDHMIQEMQDTINILQLKISKLEQLMKLKDKRIEDLSRRLRTHGLA